ncbi:50S ribosomal protein L3 [Candidatus Blochmanniella vafra str. BVAF]|uniref:Large ribosomal subunit protein uL3 n=1 Tax=Blochmanniella vafra (strain BVAF) TaxID=859654 RepID=E8Q5X7_BLOVB|nr:50S ribosomal protein L3 [Candidatus Blochmannia vafer]ADV33593.1 50S ribosomal protein L3 [Candidatus Blochmannia vafer str. BVAF]
MNGLIGRKLGMTRLFGEDGVSIPVTMVEVLPNHVIQIKNLKRDGYCAVQVTTGHSKVNCLNKPQLGHLKKAGVKPGKGLWEFRVNSDSTISLGDVITIEIFKNAKEVDVTGISKGKGFSGTIKRWNFHTQDASHGNSLSHRAPGSIGQNQTPGKVFKGKKMAGQLGNSRVTVQNLKIINVNLNDNVLLIKGAIPGTIGEHVIVKKSIKVKFGNAGVI